MKLSFARSFAEAGSGYFIFLSLALVVYSLFLNFFNLGGATTLWHHEALVGLTAREMLFNGNWLVPHMNGVPRLEKTPLAYWMVAGLGSLVGEVDEWTVRAPAALSGVLLVMLVGYWAYQWYDRRVALCAALIQSTVLYAIKWGRVGTIDMPHCFLTGAALYAAAQRTVARPNDPDSSGKGRFYLGIGWCLLVGLTGLAKPLFGIIIVAAPCLLFLFLYRRSRLLTKLVHPLGLVLFLMLTVTWPYLILLEIPSAWQTWQKETFQRVVDTGRYYEPVWFYLAAIPLLTLPWTPVLLPAMARSWRKACIETDGKERFLWTWFLTQTILLSLSKGKNPHYVLPALPALSLMGGQELARWLARFDWKKWRLGLGSSLIIASSATCLAIGAALALSRRWPETLSIWLWSCAAVVTLGNCLCLCLLRIARPLAAAIIGSLTVAVILGIVLACIEPALDPRRPGIDFVRHLNHYLQPRDELTIYKPVFTSLAFYVDRAFRQEDTLMGLQKRLIQSRRLFVLTGSETMEELKKIGHLFIVAEMAPSIEEKRKTLRLVLLELTI